MIHITYTLIGITYFSYITFIFIADTIYFSALNELFQKKFVSSCHVADKKCNII